MDIKKLVESWPVYRQLTGADPLGRGKAARSQARRRALTAAHRDRRPRRAVRLPLLRRRLRAEGLRQGREGRPDRGRPGLPDLPRPAVPQGLGQQAAGHQPAARRRRSATAAPYGTEWEDLDLDTAMEMIADRVLDARAQELAGRRRRGPARCAARMGIASLGGATLDNEENYLIKKLFTAHGRDPDREPGPHLTLRHGPRSGDLVRSRRRHELPAGPRRTPTASSSRAPTWPRPTRWASSG